MLNFLICALLLIRITIGMQLELEERYQDQNEKLEERDILVEDEDVEFDVRALGYVFQSLYTS